MLDTFLQILMMVVGAVIATVTTLLGINFQSKLEDKRHRRDYILSVQNEPLKNLRAAIDIATQMLTHFDKARGYLEYGFRTQVSVSEKMTLDFAYSLRKAGIAIDSMEAPEHIGSDIISLSQLAKIAFELINRTLETNEYTSVKAELEQVTKQFGQHLISLEKGYRQLMLQAVETDKQLKSNKERRVVGS